MKRFFVFAGTRPEIIKLAPLFWELKRQNLNVEFVISGQHSDTLKGLLEVFDLKENVHFLKLEDNTDLLSIYSSILKAVGEFLGKLDEEVRKKSVAIVQGDTATTFAAAFASFLKGLEVVHIEAGLRTKNMRSPFPEEMNRRLVSELSTYHFAPTDRAKSNLLCEGVNPERIWVVGNTGIDSLVFVLSERVKKLNLENSRSYLQRLLSSEFKGNTFELYKNLNESGLKFILKDVLKKVNIRAFDKLILITFHRRENFKAASEYAQAILEVALEFKKVLFTFVWHPNMQSQKFKRVFARHGLENTLLLPPLDYALFSMMLLGADLVITDSGGIQEETAFLGKPCFVMRRETERIEVLDKNVRLFPVPEQLKSFLKEVLTDFSKLKSYYVKSFVYGDGKAANKIVKILKESGDSAGEF